MSSWWLIIPCNYGHGFRNARVAHTSTGGSSESQPHLCFSRSRPKRPATKLHPTPCHIWIPGSKTGWWFQPLWKIFVNGKDYPIYICIYIYYGKKNVFQTTKQKIKRTCSIIILTVRTVSQSGHHESNHEHVGVGKTLAESMLVKHVLSQTTRPNRSTQVNHTVPLPYWQTEGFQNKLAHISYTVSSKNLFMTSSFNILTQMVIWKML